MTSINDVILTAIKYRGIDQVKAESKQLADKLFCSEWYVKRVVKGVEAKKILIG